MSYHTLTLFTVSFSGADCSIATTGGDTPLHIFARCAVTLKLPNYDKKDNKERYESNYSEHVFTLNYTLKRFLQNNLGGVHEVCESSHRRWSFGNVSKRPRRDSVPGSQKNKELMITKTAQIAIEAGNLYLATKLFDKWSQVGAFRLLERARYSEVRLLDFLGSPFFSAISSRGQVEHSRDQCGVPA